MATPAQSPTSQTTLPSLDSLKLSINASGDSGLNQAIVTNDAFPASPADITVGKLSAQVAPGEQFNLRGVNNVPVGFSVSASANSSLAAYLNPANLPSDLGFADRDGPLNVSFPGDGKSRFLVVQWGFDLSGQASGKMALDPAVNITFGASGGTDGLFAFVRAVDPSMHARDAFLALLKAWCTPRAVANNYGGH